MKESYEQPVTSNRFNRKNKTQRWHTHKHRNVNTLVNLRNWVQEPGHKYKPPSSLFPRVNPVCRVIFYLFLFFCIVIALQVVRWRKIFIVIALLWLDIWLLNLLLGKRLTLGPSVGDQGFHSWAPTLGLWVPSAVRADISGSLLPILSLLSSINFTNSLATRVK